MSAFIWFVSKTPRMPRCFPQIWFLGQALWRGEDKRILRLPCLLFNDTCDSSGAVNFLQNLNKLIDECFFPHAKPCRDVRGSSSTDGLKFSSIKDKEVSFSYTVRSWQRTSWLFVLLNCWQTTWCEIYDDVIMHTAARRPLHCCKSR